MSCSLLFIQKSSVKVYLCIRLWGTYGCVGAINEDAELPSASWEPPARWIPDLKSSFNNRFFWIFCDVCNLGKKTIIV